MKAALLGLFSSKKALAGMAGAATTAVILLAQRAGYGLDPAATQTLVTAVLGLAGVYILGQGVSDHGKEKSKIEHAAMELLMKAQRLEDNELDELDEFDEIDDSGPTVLTEEA